MGTGGARIGAGGPAFWAKAEQLIRVEIREWHRRGLLWVAQAFLAHEVHQPTEIYPPCCYVFTRLNACCFVVGA